MLTTLGIYAVLIALGVLATSVVRHVRALHMLQLDSYSNRRFIRWLFGAPSRLLDARNTALFGLVGLIHITAALLNTSGTVLIGATVWALGCAYLAFAKPGVAPVKKPLVFTGRALRILSLSVIFLTVVYVFGAILMERWLSPHYRGTIWASAGMLALGWSLVQVSPAFVVAANLVLQPVQSALNGYYVRLATRKLRRLNPKVVGFTGSYGKTSTKYFTTSILGTRYRVLKTPESFNTLLGVCRVINDELAREHEVFLVEMGAYRRGDIREIATMVNPSIGVITAIGPQHLERFGSIQAIEKAKYELIESLPNNGVAIFNYDDTRCARLADDTKGPRVVRYGVSSKAPGLDLWATDVEYGAKGLVANISTSIGDNFEIRANVLGRHNLSNILAAICVARELDLTNSEIARGCLSIKPAPHRLELLGRADGAIVIDDSYNSNPVGAINALEALSQFKTGSRILITPGMIELGEEQERWNEEFGMKAAQTCDQVILVGPQQTKPILKGLDKAGFSASACFVAKDLKEATARLNTIVKRGDVILFENDLPDLYAET